MGIGTTFLKRLLPRLDELKWLYYELYAFLPMEERTAQFAMLLESMRVAAGERSDALQKIDAAREEKPDWYLDPSITGMCLYVNEFAKTLKGVKNKLDYLEECGVRYLHLMPLLDTVDGESDGGYAVSDFRKVKPSLGTMADLDALTGACHDRNIVCCMDFVMNHTGSGHEWAKRAKAGEKEYQDYYFFYDDREIPDEFEKTVPQVFPTTAPGSFTEVPECGKIVMTSFYPYQWDLNYRNPAVFRAMTENLLYLANRGIDVVRIDAVPYIWKELGTDCRNLSQVHAIVRMMRLICEAVCPGTILLGEVVMAPEKLAPYFGPVERPECHMLYNATSMCTIWNTVATADTRLLRHQLRTVVSLPESFTFLNYIRCHDDIGWGLDYEWLKRIGQKEVPHKAYINAWFAGEWEGSPSRGERYNDDPRLGDARMCGTTASLCGLETALEKGDPMAVEEAVRLDLMLHSLIFFQKGLPMLYAGDEIGQLNDNGYHDDPLKADDSRYLHRGAFNWKAARMRHNVKNTEGMLFEGITKIEELRATHPAFGTEARLGVFDAANDHILGMTRECRGVRVVALYNFSARPQEAECPVWVEAREMFSGEKKRYEGKVKLLPYECVWLEMIRK